MSIIPLVPHAETLFPARVKNSVRLLRHATLLVEFGGLKFLVDPMLSTKGQMDPVGNAGNDIRIPMLELPLNAEELKAAVNAADAVLVSHTHRDHWDQAAKDLIDKEKQIFCQPADAAQIKGEGFQNVSVVGDSLIWKGVKISRTSGKHGTGEIGEKMGIVSGFVLEQGKVSLYIAGDTIWCEDVKNALQKYKPAVTVLNGGAATFSTGGPITMTPGDIAQVCSFAAATKVIAVHMDTVNHCRSSRKDLEKFLEEHDLAARVTVPADGEIIELGS